MRAITYSRYGGPEVLELTDQPVPKVAPGMVLIKVKAAAVNPVDWKVMGGHLDQLMDVQFPVIPGWDVAGTVERVGIDTPEFAVGDEVISNARRDSVHQGTFAEYVAVAADEVARKPQALEWDEAAGLPLAGLTAYQVLDRLDVRAGETVLIHGGSGGVGAFGIQLAVDRGARVLATASERNHEYLRSLGAEPVEYGDGLAERVRTLAPEGVDVVADFVGGVLDATLAVLKAGGRHASIADNSVQEHGGTWMWVRPLGTDLAELGRLADAGRLKVRVAKTFGLDQAADAYRLSMQGHAVGKIIVRVS